MFPIRCVKIKGVIIRVVLSKIVTSTYTRYSCVILLWAFWCFSINVKTAFWHSSYSAAASCTLNWGTTLSFHIPAHLSPSRSAVGIATGYGLDDLAIESRWRRDFPLLSRPALGPTQPPVQWVPGLFRGLRAVGAWRWPLTPLLVPWLIKTIAIPLLHVWAVRPVQSSV